MGIQFDFSLFPAEKLRLAVCTLIEERLFCTIGSASSSLTEKKNTELKIKDFSCELSIYLYIHSWLLYTGGPHRSTPDAIPMWMSCKYSNCAVYLRQLTALPSVTDNWFTKLIPIFIKLRDKVHVSLTEYITESMSCHEVHTVNTIGLFCAEILTWLTLLCKSLESFLSKESDFPQIF